MPLLLDKDCPSGPNHPNSTVDPLAALPGHVKLYCSPAMLLPEGIIDPRETSVKITIKSGCY
jgi:hypothetical protein